MRVLVQQPQFMPWIGFWNKLIMADLYVIYAGVKFNKDGHQHRVKIDDAWMTLPVGSEAKHQAICDVRVQDMSALKRIAKTLMYQVCNTKAPYSERLFPLMHCLEKWTGTDYLLEIDITVLIYLMEALGLDTLLSLDTTKRDGLGKIEKLAEALKEHTQPPFIYLTGGGLINYTAPEAVPADEIWVQEYRENLSTNSIVTLIANKEHPLDEIKQAATWRKVGGQREDTLGPDL